MIGPLVCALSLPFAPRNVVKLGVQWGGTGGKSYHSSSPSPSLLIPDSIPPLHPSGWFQNLLPYPILSLNSESARSALIPACWNWGRSRSQIRDFWCNSAQDSSSALQPRIVCVSLCTCEFLPHMSVFKSVATPGDCVSPLPVCVWVGRLLQKKSCFYSLASHLNSALAGARFSVFRCVDVACR